MNVSARRGHSRIMSANHICMMHEGGVVCCERIARFIFNSSKLRLILSSSHELLVITVQCRLGAALAIPSPLPILRRCQGRADTKRSRDNRHDAFPTPCRYAV
jgi:hypothetical protein